MELLRRLAGAALLLSASLARAESSCLLGELDFEGYVQGRVTVHAAGAPKAAGILNTLPVPDRAGGEAETQGLIERLEFKLSGLLPWDHWKVAVGAALTGSKGVIKDAYLEYAPEYGAHRLTFGRFRVPFGLDTQGSSSRMDTVERPLVYGFGNYGWVGPLGMEFCGERDLGARLDLDWERMLGAWAPFAQAACVLGSGRDVVPGRPFAMARAGWVGWEDHAPLPGLVRVAVSGAYGDLRLERRQEAYLPAGAVGDLETNPGAALFHEDLGGAAPVRLLGADLFARQGGFACLGEVVERRIGNRRGWGYYLTLKQRFHGLGLPAEAVLRWEEASAGYADGIHVPGRRYLAATAGVNLDVARGWRVQADYLRLGWDSRFRDFPGAALFIVQVQALF